MTKRQVFYSFHFKNDSWRAGQVRNIGVVEGNMPVSSNDWEVYFLEYLLLGLIPKSLKFDYLHLICNKRQPELRNKHRFVHGGHLDWL